MSPKPVIFIITPSLGVTCMWRDEGGGEKREMERREEEGERIEEKWEEVEDFSASSNGWTARHTARHTSRHTTQAPQTDNSCHSEFLMKQKQSPNEEI